MTGARDKKPWYPRYQRDFVHGVTGLGSERVGVYALVLDLIYDRRGAIPDDPKWLAGILGDPTRKISRILDELTERGKLTRGDGQIHNERAAEILGDMEAFRELQSLRGSKRWRAKRPTNSDLFEPDTNENKDLGARSAMPDRQNENGTRNKHLFPNYSQTNRKLFRSDINRNKDLADFPGCQPEPYTEVVRTTSDRTAVPDVKKVIFDVGLPALAQMSGKTEEQLRPLIGKWLHKCGKDPGQILDLLAAADREQPFEPVAWIEQRLKPKTSPQPSGSRNLADAIAHLTRPHH